MFLFGQSEFDTNSPESEDEVQELTEEDEEAIALAQPIQQQVLDEEEKSDYL